MRAAAVRQYGGPECISVEDLPAPKRRAGEVRVRVHYAPVNPTDLMLRAGAQAKAFETIPPPLVPGLEFAGIIEEIDGDPEGMHVGDAVMGIASPRRAQGGSQAEYVVVPAADVAPLPEGLSLEAASMIPMNGLTAAMVIDWLEPATGKTLLVTGAAGILGGYVVQLAQRAGMTVIAHGRAGDRSYLEQLGVAGVISDDEDLVAAVRAITSSGVDGLADAANLGVVAEDAVRDGGISVQVLSMPPRPETSRIVRRAGLNVLEAFQAPGSLSEKARSAGLDVLTPRVAQVLPLSEVARAHELAGQGRLRGRVVLDLADLPDSVE